MELRKIAPISHNFFGTDKEELIKQVSSVLDDLLNSWCCVYKVTINVEQCFDFEEIKKHGF